MMVSSSGGRVTLTPAEAAVMAMLRDGPADLGPRTEVVRRGELEVRRVDMKVARRLAKHGFVSIDAGGQASIDMLTVADLRRLHGQDS